MQCCFDFRIAMQATMATLGAISIKWPQSCKRLLSWAHPDEETHLGRKTAFSE